MRKLTLTILALITIFVLAACGNSGNNAEETNDGDGGKLAELQDKGVIQVVFANEKPYGYENDKGEITGASVDTDKAVFAEFRIDVVEIHLADYDHLVLGLGVVKFDAITSGMAITPDRCENAVFGEPVMNYGEGLIVQKGIPETLQSYTDIA